MPDSKQANQTIEELRDRYESMSTDLVRLQTQKELAEKDLKELKQQAQEQFGTDDVKQLKKLLADMKKKNEKATVEYQKKLDQVDAELLKIDEAVEQGED